MCIRDRYTYTGLDGYLEFTPVMAYGDFQLLWKALGYEELSLGKQEYLLLTSEKIQERSRREEVPALEIQGETYQLKELSSRPFSTGSGLHGTGFLVVLPDEAAETFPVYHTCYVFETKKEIPANEGMESVSYTHLYPENPAGRRIFQWHGRSAKARTDS